METFNFNKTSLHNTSYLNSSTDLSFWESLSIVSVPYNNSCFFIYHFEFKNLTLQLYPWKKLKELFSMCQDILLLRTVVFWLSLAIGIPGNILAFLTITKFPKTTGTFYLALLSVSDFMALVTKAINVGMITLRKYDAVSCKLIITFSNFTATYANWVLVLICFERLVTILFPLKKSFYFTLRRARLSALLLAVILFLLDSVYLWVYTADNGCVPYEIELYLKWSHVSTTMYSYLPSALLIIMVTLIWKELRNIQKNRKYIFCGEEGSASSAATQQRLHEQAQMERSITMMLLFASITFICLTLPLCVMIVIDNSKVLEHSTVNAVNKELALAICYGLVFLSHAVNFFIYFVSTERFRSHLLKLFRCSMLTKRFSAHDPTAITLEDQI